MKFRCFYNLEKHDGQIEAEVRALPLTYRKLPSLVNFKDSHIFAIGGQDHDDSRMQQADRHLCSVEFYDEAQDLWRETRDLNDNRYSSSSCVLGDWIYTFGGHKGHNENMKKLKSIERINALQAIQAANENQKDRVAWEFIARLN